MQPGSQGSPLLASCVTQVLQGHLCSHRLPDIQVVYYAGSQSTAAARVQVFAARSSQILQPPHAHQGGGNGCHTPWPQAVAQLKMSEPC